MKMGVFTKYLEAECVERLADKTAALALDGVVLDTYPGLDIDVARPRPADCRRIRQAFADAGVEIAAIGAYSNIIHPDPAKRAAIRDHVRGRIRMCAEIGCPMICMEMGSYAPRSGQWDPSNMTEPVFAVMTDVLGRLADEATQHGVLLAVEPYVMTAAYDADRLGRLIRALNRDNVRAIVDPAGLLTRATLNAQHRVVPYAFEALAPWIGLIHTHDCRPLPEWADHFDWLAAGTGLLDYPLFMDSAVRSGYDGYLVMEFLEEARIAETAAFVRGQWRQAVSRH